MSTKFSLILLAFYGKIYVTIEYNGRLFPDKLGYLAEENVMCMGDEAYAYDDPRVMRDEALIAKARAEHLKGKDPFEALEYVLRHFDQDQDVA